MLRCWKASTKGAACLPPAVNYWLKQGWVSWGILSAGITVCSLQNYNTAGRTAPTNSDKARKAAEKQPSRAYMEIPCRVPRWVSPSFSRWSVHTSDVWWRPWDSATAKCLAGNTWRRNRAIPCRPSDSALYGPTKHTHMPNNNSPIHSINQVTVAVL